MTYRSLHHRNNQRGIAAVVIALLFCFAAYLLFSSLAWYTYGDAIQPNIFENIKEDKGILSIILRCLFLFIFLCNIPFVFFAGRECFITFIMEIKERKVSKKLVNELSKRDVTHNLIDDELRNTLRDTDY
jgi:hypothetical protein